MTCPGFVAAGPVEDGSKRAPSVNTDVRPDVGAPAPKQRGKKRSRADGPEPSASKASGVPESKPPDAKKARGRPKVDVFLRSREEVAAYAKVPHNPTHPEFRKYLGDEAKPKQRQLKDINAGAVLYGR